ncbi:MAG: hypothetical protein ACRC35_04355 [Angustibacter sp.]
MSLISDDHIHHHTGDRAPSALPGRPRGPERFVRQQAVLDAAAAEDGRPGRLRALGSGLALLLLVVGVPALLIRAGGVPHVPASWPDRQALSQALDVAQVVQVLLLIVWVAWLQFTVCVVVEAVSALRGVGLPARVPLSGPTQRMARGLVGALLVAGVVTAGTAGTAAGATAGIADERTARPGSTPVSAAGWAPDAWFAATGMTAEVGRPAAVDPSAGFAVHPTDARSAGAHVPGSAGQHGMGLAVGGRGTFGAPPPSASPADPASGWGEGQRAGRVPADTQGQQDVTSSAGGRATQSASTQSASSQQASSQQARGQKVYTVRPPQGRYHDNLWDIAERHLGDGRRYPEIYQLNVGVEQPDGRRLELSRLIHPGWRLVMPEDARGVPREQVTVTHDPSAALGTGGGGGQGAGSADERATESGSALGGPGQADERVGELGSPDRGVLTPGGGLVGGLLMAGLLVALRRARRRPASGPPDLEEAEVEVALRVGADLHRSQMVDVVLRDLVDRCRVEGLARPAVFAARVSADQVELLLAPPSTRAPRGWEPVGDGSCWRSPLGGPVVADGPLIGQSTAAAGDGSSGPFPALVSVGTDAEGRDVLLDLATAGGPIALTGDPAGVAGLATAMAVSLATSPWAGGLTIQVGGLSDAVRSVAPDRLRVVADPAALLTELGSAARPSHDDILTGDPTASSTVVVLASEPDLEAIAALTAPAGRRLGGVVVAADIPGASWQLRVDEAGTVAVRPLGLEVTGARLDPAVLPVLARLVAGARQAHREPAIPDDEVLPAPPAGVDVDDAAWLASRCRVALLGVPEVYAPGALDPSRILLATEVVAYLALHRGAGHASGRDVEGGRPGLGPGVHPEVLAAAIWPRGVGADVRDATVARARDWLGADEHGAALLITGADGRLRLSDRVASDWDVVCSLVARARVAHGQAGEADLLRRALRVVRGPLLSGVPHDRYAWLARTGIEGTVVRTVVAAAHRLSTVLLDDDPPAAQVAASGGLRLAPREQLLWRDLMRAAHRQDGSGDGPGDGGPVGASSASGGSARVLEAVRQARAVLSDLGDPLDARTEALIEELAPGLPARLA